jgi:hypothetical protein
MILRIALGSADKRITMAIAVRTELRENEIFIYGLPAAKLRCRRE